MSPPEKIDWHETFTDAMFLQMEMAWWTSRDHLGPGKWQRTIWFWFWGIVAIVTILSPHPFSWLWALVSVVPWLIASFGMHWLDKRYNTTKGNNDSC